ncbi:flagellar hook assembly protein FlgD [Ralstonia sp. SM1864_UCD524_TZ4]|uniref:Basal-body rod modification protein FlgD n=1 Tax=Ralstonia solanacearum TaxID=305 RepID=A0A0S4US23_RALSL|nr:flagellar hook assembly protein FlgD [Ralstonia pseudosolanacearum]CUV25021.1 flagellar hook assembly protein [Ralstonia solanacearum]CUV34631.1 flagellar hook assembly protein [Ralstonia solanacearum]CUV41998.1 flagellar hook assembly protein [Ralstonia solanacearum]CUV59189.1 flagellar hook assembly protein [Ralstonia solanacearum]
MTVSSTTSTTSTSSTTSTTGITSQTGTDLQNTFMQLLVAQLKNQDPLNPMDNSQLTSQLAQINTVNGIAQLNTTMSSMATQSAASQASSLIGRTVEVPSSTLTLSSSSASFGVSVPNGADDVVVTIKNASGTTVRTVDLGQVSAGTSNYTWNGKDDKGNTLSDGTYTISVAATLSGSTTTASALGTDKVIGVTINSGTTLLQLASGGTTKLSNVTTIQ